MPPVRLQGPSLITYTVVIFRHFLSTYCVSGTVFCTADTEMNKTIPDLRDAVPPSKEEIFHCAIVIDV